MAKRYYPHLSTEEQVEIEGEETKVHEKFWEELKELGFPNFFEQLLEPLASGPSTLPVKQPKKLMYILQRYASELFGIESKKYPDDNQFLSLWLNALKVRVFNSITDRIRYLKNLDYHASEDSMHDAIWGSLQHATNQRLFGLEPTSNSRKPEMPVPKRLPGTVTSPKAARKMEAYLRDHEIGLTDFASRAQTTDRTIRSFRRTGKVRRDIFMNIAKAMGMTGDELLSG